MLQEMDQSEFGAFVAALWERQGWQTGRRTEDGRVVVAVRRPATGEEGLLWAVPGGTEVDASAVEEFESLCADHGIGDSAIVAAGEVTAEAEQAVENTTVRLLGGEQLEAFLERSGLTDLPAEYVDSGGGDGSVLDRVRAVGRLAVAGTDSVPLPGPAVFAVVVVVALVGGGLLAGPSIPFLGGDERVSAASTTPDGNVTATLHVAWNATVTDTVDPNRTDGMAYYAPAGEEFVVVRLLVNNTGESSVALTQDSFAFRTADRTYAYQPLASHDGFVDFRIGPGQRYLAWTVFAVPEGTSGTLAYDQNATEATVAVEFERDPGLSANVSRP